MYRKQTDIARMIELSGAPQLDNEELPLNMTQANDQNDYSNSLDGKDLKVSKYGNFQDDTVPNSSLMPPERAEPNVLNSIDTKTDNFDLMYGSSPISKSLGDPRATDANSIKAHTDPRFQDVDNEIQGDPVPPIGDIDGLDDFTQDSTFAIMVKPDANLDHKMRVYQTVGDVEDTSLITTNYADDTEAKEDEIYTPQPEATKDEGKEKYTFFKFLESIS